MRQVRSECESESDERSCVQLAASALAGLLSTGPSKRTIISGSAADCTAQPERSVAASTLPQRSASASAEVIRYRSLGASGLSLAGRCTCAVTVAQSRRRAVAKVHSIYGRVCRAQS